MRRVLREHLSERRLDAITALAVERTRVLGDLVALTFDADPLIGWRAVEAMGVAAARIADRHPERVREHLRRLLWLMSEESGGICWRAPEAMAEIVHRRPVEFTAYVPIVIHLLLETAEEDLRHFRTGILWAIGRLGPLGSQYVDEVLPAIVEALEHPDARVRGTAVWCLGRLGRMEPLAGLPGLRSDEGVVEVYEDGVLTRTTVAQLLIRAERESRAGR